MLNVGLEIICEMEVDLKYDVEWIPHAVDMEYDVK